MANFGDNFRYYKDNEVVLDDFNYFSDADVQAVYAESGDGSNPTVRIITDTPNWKIGNYATRFSATHSSGASAFTATISSRDISSIVGVNSGAPLSGYIKLAVLASNSNWISTLRIGNDSSNYAAFSIITYGANEFTILELDMTSASITGTVDWTTIDYVAFIGATATGGTRTFDVSGLRVTPSTRVTGGVWNESTSQMTNTNAKSLFFLDTIGTEYVLKHPQDETVNTTEIINDVANYTYGNSFTIKSKMKWLQGGGTGYEIGVAFHISDTTKASQDCYVAYFDESDNQVNFDKFVAGTRTNLASVSYTPTVNTPYWIKVENNNGTYTISTSSDGSTFVTRIVKADSTFTGGRVGTYSCSSPVAMFYNFYAHDSVNVVYDEFSMHQRGWFNVTDIQEDSTPKTNVYTLTTTGANKDTFISQNYGSKYISVRGTISAPTTGDLTRSIDDLKSSLSKANKQLVISKPSGTSGKFLERSYSAIPINTDSMIERSDWNLTYIPFNIVFMCPDGIAVENDREQFSQLSFTLSQIQKTYHFNGNISPQPVFTYTLTDATPSSGSFDQILFSNDRTNRLLTITPTNAFADGDVLVLNFEAKSITLNSVEIGYDGSMDDGFFLEGDNTITATLGASTSLNTSQSVYETQRNFTNTATWLAQGFKVSSTTSYSTFRALLKNVSGADVTGQMNVRIETDNAGSPSGTLVASTATKTITVSLPDSSPQYFTWTLDTAVSLTSGTQYHIVIDPISITPVGSPFNGTIQWCYTATNPYSNGQSKYSTNSGSSWTGITSSDFVFEVYDAGVSGVSGTLDVSYSPRYV